MSKRFQLDPNETAMENLWRAADYATRYNLSRKRLRITDEEWKELQCRLALATVLYFLDRLRRGKYDRSVPFFVNVLGCCRASSYTVTKFLGEIREKLNLTSTDMEVGNSDTPGTLGDFMPDTGIHPLFHRVASTARYAKEIKARESPEEALNRLWAEEDERLKASGTFVDWQEIQFHRKTILQSLQSQRQEEPSSRPDTTGQ